MGLGGSAGLAVRLLTAFLLTRRAAPPAVPEKAPTCECTCVCLPAGGSESFWAFFAGLFLGTTLVCGVLLFGRVLAAGPVGPYGPELPEAPPRYRPRHAAGRAPA